MRRNTAQLTYDVYTNCGFSFIIYIFFKFCHSAVAQSVKHFLTVYGTQRSQNHSLVPALKQPNSVIVI